MPISCVSPVRRVTTSPCRHSETAPLFVDLLISKHQAENDPAALRIAPGARTGKFRLGKDAVLIGADGKSRISIPDYAIALVDELETPRHIRQRFTVGY